MSYAAGAGMSGAQDEQQLVEDMCTPAGVRAQPTSESLKAFVENAASCNGTVIAQALQEKMVTTACMCTITACMQ